MSRNIEGMLAMRQARLLLIKIGLSNDEADDFLQKLCSEFLKGTLFDEQLQHEFYRRQAEELARARDNKQPLAGRNQKNLARLEGVILGVAGNALFALLQSVALRILDLVSGIPQASSPMIPPDRALSPIILLVLSPMRPLTDESAEATSRASRPSTLVRMIADEIMSQLGIVIHVDVIADSQSSDVVPNILRGIESADLIVCDVSCNSPNVMYGLALVHAFDLPHVVVTSDVERPFHYVWENVLVRDLELSELYDPTRESHQILLEHIRQYVATQLTSSSYDTGADGVVNNPVSAYFNGIPIVDISGAAGLAAAYWSNTIRDFVRPGGFFDYPQCNFIPLAYSDGPEIERLMTIQHFIVVRPGQEADFHSRESDLERTLGELGLCRILGNITPVEPFSLRPFLYPLLGRTESDGSVAPVQPGIVIENPTVLDVLRYSVRIMHIRGKEIITPNRNLEQQLHRRYQEMLDQFGRLLQYYLRASNSKHQDQVHFVSLRKLPALLAQFVTLT